MKKNFETLAIRDTMDKTQYGEHSSAMFLNSSFQFESAEVMQAAFAEEIDRNIYSRYSNPNTSEYAHKLASLEGTEDGLATATGMSAVFGTFAALCNAGDHILSGRSVFGNTHTILTKFLPKFNVSHTYVDVNKPETWAEHVRPNTRLFYIETPTNPLVDIMDMELASKLCREHNMIFIVDNCFATPYLQRPVDFGADIIIHSSTKFIDGQGRVLGGAILGTKEMIREHIFPFIKNSGPALSPFNAWVLSKSLETLAVRMDRHCDNAIELATRLQDHTMVDTVRYPFLESHPAHSLAKKQMKKGGGVLSMKLKGGIGEGRTFLNGLEMCSRTANLGDAKTIVSHPASTTHSKLTPEERATVGISDGLVRISVGLEHVDDIYEDVVRALESI